MKYVVLVVALAGMAGCDSAATTVLVEIDGVDRTLSALDVQAAVDGRVGVETRPFAANNGAVALPVSALIVLKDGVETVHVRLDGTRLDGSAFSVEASAVTVPHTRTLLSLVIDGDAAAPDLSTVGSVPDLASVPDLGPVVLAQDNFNRANQTYWGTASDGQVWGGDANALSPPFSIAANAGVLSNGASGTSYQAQLGGVASDVDVSLVGKLDNVSQGCNLGLFARVNGAKFYKAFIDGSNLVIRLEQSGVKTVLGTSALSVAAGQLYQLRFQAIGQTLRARAWPAASAEPSSWLVTGSDATLASGNTGLHSYPPGCTVTVTSFVAMHW